MKMQMIMAIALLMWVGAASAQSTFSLSVNVHRNLPPLTENEVKGILAGASNMLQKNSGRVDTENDVACNATFTLKGSVRTFGSPDLPANVDKEHIDAVHRVDSDVEGVDFHVKVVKKITDFCRVAGQFHGCSFPPHFHSIIVEHPLTHTDPEHPSADLPKGKLPDHLLWAHEFGHLTGLGHRIEPGVTSSSGQPLALLTPCDLSRFSDVSDARVQVTRGECRCLLGGPGSCPLPAHLGCPQ